MTPRITVAVCTWNRAKSLKRALDSIVTAIEVFGSSVQLIVVNNNCTDDTDQIIAAVSKRAALTYVHESRAGLANARNAATRATCGDYVIWTDDDVVVSPHWLEAYAKAFIEFSHAAFYGGPIRPEFEHAPPAWLAAGWRQIPWIYAARDLGERPCAITNYGEVPYGANFAVRSDLQRHIRYDPRLGRQPANYWLGGEEVDVLTRLLDEQHQGRWVPAAALVHYISNDRQTLAYVVKHAFGSGQSKEVMQPAKGRSLLFGRPVWLWAKWARSMGQVALAAVTGGSDKWLPAVYRAVEMSGRLYTPRPLLIRAVPAARHTRDR
jgi:glucosyl-dolichyl phosphate glucuronosyltransferase